MDKGQNVGSDHAQDLHFQKSWENLSNLQLGQHLPFTWKMFPNISNFEAVFWSTFMFTIHILVVFDDLTTGLFQRFFSINFMLQNLCIINIPHKYHLPNSFCQLSFWMTHNFFFQKWCTIPSWYRMCRDWWGYGIPGSDSVP